ncbi:MAG: 30S ribosomal protein S17e [Candidatus Woesearchaeota archaeon]
MGRIKTKLAKRLATELVKKYPETFAKTFEENKKKIPTYVEIPSKKTRNVVAGYLTRLMKNRKEY